MTIPTDYRDLDEKHFGRNVVSQNVVTKFRDALEVYQPITGNVWIERKASGDIVALDGNAVGSSYLDISKDPLTANTVTTITTRQYFEVPIKAAAGANLRNYITGIDYWSEALTNATEIAIRDGAGGTVIWRAKIGTAGLLAGRAINFPTPIRPATANSLLEVVTLSASGAGAVYFNATGFVAP